MLFTRYLIALFQIFPNYCQICLVFTDGEASDKEKVPSAAQAWAEDGVTVFAIGIGSNVKHDGLKAIAGADERAFEVATFDAIADIASGLLKHICEKAGKLKASDRLPQK